MDLALAHSVKLVFKKKCTTIKLRYTKEEQTEY